MLIKKDLQYKKNCISAWICNSFCAGNTCHVEFQLRGGEGRVWRCISFMGRARFTKGYELCPLVTDIHQQ